MRKGRKIKLKYKQERVLLSDVLPYELPIIMSNRMLYRFCVKNKIRYKQYDNKLYWSKHIDGQSFEVLRLIFGLAFDKKHLPSDGVATLKIYSTIPFVFHILHKQNEFRALSLIHPALQIGISDFYDRYKSLMIYYCNRSNFSLRYPHKVASYFYYKDKLHHVLLGKKKDNIELFFNEYENLKTYFSYKKYTQIFRFYDDYRFQRAEKRFAHLFRFDLQKCFDSIYTHSIAWATQGGKEIYKKDFKGKDNSSFGGRFDTIMQKLNYDETNGIVIGPEFSRIFAEIILQHIDRNIEYELQTNRNKALINGENYLLYRYVDDYFLFYNDEYVKDKIIELFQRHLEEYKLRISREKSIGFDRPFYTDISKAKIRIDQLINDWFKYRSPSVCVESEEDADDEELDFEVDGTDIVNNANNDFTPEQNKINEILAENGYFPLVSRKFNQAYKDILTTVGVAHKDVINYTLSCICTRVERELKKFDKSYKYLIQCCHSTLTQVRKENCEEKIRRLEHKLSKYLCDVVDSTFFLFSACPRLNATLKLMRLLNCIIIFVDGSYLLGRNNENVIKRFSDIIRSQVFGQIHLEVINIFKHNKCHDYAQLEILYLLIIMKMIDSKHAISPKLMEDFLCLDEMNGYLNAIALSTVFYYIGNKSNYNELKTKLVEHVCQKMQKKKLTDLRKDSESVILILDVCCCPFLDKSQKKRILSCSNLEKESINQLINFGNKTRYMFTKWDGIKMTKELAAKVSQEVYS